MNLNDLQRAYNKCPKNKNNLNTITYFCHGVKLNFEIKDGVVHTINISPENSLKKE